MDDNQSNNQQEPTTKPPSSSSSVDQETKPTILQTMSDQQLRVSTQEQDNNTLHGRFFKAKNRKKAVIFIGIPILLFIISPAFGTLYIAVLLASPILYILIIYGIVLLFKKDKAVSEANMNILKKNHTESYKLGLIMFAIGSILLLLAYMILRSIRQEEGHSGSESEIVAWPLIFSGVLLTFISIASLLISFARNNTISRRPPSPEK